MAKSMTLTEALQRALLNEGVLKRRSWETARIQILIRNGTQELFCRGSIWSPQVDDLLATDWMVIPFAQQSTEPCPPERQTCGGCTQTKRQAVWPTVLISIATALATNAVLLWLGL